MKLWGGRFTHQVDDLVNTFNSSISFDSRMYNWKYSSCYYAW